MKHMRFLLPILLLLSLSCKHSIAVNVPFSAFDTNQFVVDVGGNRISLLNTNGGGSGTNYINSLIPRLISIVTNSPSSWSLSPNPDLLTNHANNPQFGSVTTTVVADQGSNHFASGSFSSGGSGFTGFQSIATNSAEQLLFYYRNTVVAGITNSVFYANGLGITNIAPSSIQTNGGSSGQVLTISSGVAAWVTPSGGGSGVTTLLATNAPVPSVSGTTGFIPTNYAGPLVVTTQTGNFTVNAGTNVVICTGSSLQYITLANASGFREGDMVTVWSDGSSSSVAVTNYNGSQKITVPGIGQGLAALLGSATSPTNGYTFMVHNGHW